MRGQVKREMLNLTINYNLTLLNKSINSQQQSLTISIFKSIISSFNNHFSLYSFKLFASSFNCSLTLLHLFFHYSFKLNNTTNLHILSQTPSMDSQQIAVENFITYIKNISLHFQNLFAPSQTDLKGITNKTFKLINDFQKFVIQYNLKVLKQIENAKITVPLIFYRSIKDHVNDPSFMLYKFKDYEMKFIFIRINLQCHAHIQIFKNIDGVRKPCKALEKLQNGFVFMIYKKLTEGYNPQTISVKFFEINALNYLEQVYYLMNGDIVCHKCRKAFSYHSELKILLPPTVRLQNFKSKNIDSDNLIKPKQSKLNQLSIQHVDFKNPPKYSHQGCI